MYYAKNLFHFRALASRIFRAILYKGLIHMTRTTLLLTSAVIGISTLTFTPTAYAIGDLDTPTGEAVVGGAATFDRPVAGQLNINQSTDRAVINWNTFNIGKDASTKFIQPNSGSLAVNRVVGGGTFDPTQILGKLEANGKVMILDRNGVFFGPNSRVDVGSIAVGTGDVDTVQVIGGETKIRIDNVAPGSVIENQGRITVAQAGLAAFVAPTIKNSGTITAKLGKVGFGAGQKVIFDMYGDGLISVALASNLDHVDIQNTGKIAAEGGLVQMTARTAANIVDSTINTSGIVDVSSVTVKGGNIILSGDADITVAGKLDAGSTLDAGNISLKGRDTNINGSVYAESKNGKGGYIDMGALEHTTTANGKVKATGKTEGGVVKIAGGGAQINTPALVDVSSSNGKGGRITVDMNSIITPDTIGQINVDGQLRANGKTDGGQIEFGGNNAFFGSASQVLAEGTTGIGGQISVDVANAFDGYGYVSASGFTNGGHVSVHAGDINVPGQIRSMGDGGAGGSVSLRAVHLATIGGTVNTKGLTQGGLASVQAADINIPGLINTESTGSGIGGRVTVLASNTVTVGGTGKLKASGIDGGGQVKISSQDIIIDEGALLIAASTGSLRGGPGFGDGGTVVIASPNTVTGGVDVSAPNGATGTFIH